MWKAWGHRREPKMRKTRLKEKTGPQGEAEVKGLTEEEEPTQQMEKQLGEWEVKARCDVLKAKKDSFPGEKQPTQSAARKIILWL